MKKVISFDLDGTLVDARYGDAVWNRGVPEEFAKRHGLSFDEARARITAQYRAVGDGEILWYHIEHWLAKFELDVAPRELLDRFEGHIALKPHAQEVLEELSTRYTLAVASNAARIFVEKELEHAGIAGHFTHIVSATSDYGMVKKGPPFYVRLCADLGVSPQEVVHVGDHPIFDHDAPKNAGMEAFLVFDDYRDANDGYGRPNGRRMIDSLKYLLEAL
jgi:putative hydrolase of the HAD superfamily